MKPLRIGLLSCVLLLSNGCFLKKKAAVVVPVKTPLTPIGTPAPETPATIAPPTEPATGGTTPLPPAEAVKPSPFPPPVTPPKRPPSRPARQVPVAPPPVTPVPVEPAPALGAILTPERRRQLDEAYQADLKLANSLLSHLNGRNMTPDQLDSVSRAKAWIRQAGQYHNRDLATAAELARRARVLTQDLAGALQ